VATRLTTRPLPLHPLLPLLPHLKLVLKMEKEKRQRKVVQRHLRRTRKRRKKPVRRKRKHPLLLLQHPRREEPRRRFQLISLPCKLLWRRKSRPRRRPVEGRKRRDGTYPRACRSALVL